jgi:hypothetical protein
MISPFKLALSLVIKNFFSQRFRIHRRKGEGGIGRDRDRDREKEKRGEEGDVILFLVFRRMGF